MNYLYLDPSFKPFGSTEIYHDTKTYSGGEENVRIKTLSLELITSLNDHVGLDQDITIVHRCNSSSDLMRIIIANDALKNAGAKKIHLFLPYLPYARQDSIHVEGESLSIKVFANLINSCKFESVTLFDPHSNVGPALIENVKIDNERYYRFVRLCLSDIISKTKSSIDDIKIVSPDAGAYKKIFKTCKEIKFDGGIVICNKARNLKTIEIESLVVVGDVKDKVCIIIDDICDGGRTFAEVGQQLKEKGARAVYLIVTHGIFSYGEDQIKAGINHVWSTNSFKSYESDFVTFIDIGNISIMKLFMSITNDEFSTIIPKQ